MPPKWNQIYTAVTELQLAYQQAAYGARLHKQGNFSAG